MSLLLIYTAKLADRKIGQLTCRGDHASWDLQAIGRVYIQASDLLRRFSIYPQELDDQLCLVAGRDPMHPVLHPETDTEVS